MSFFNPLGFIALLGIPLIIVMYILKEKHKEVRVPSSFLWKKAAASSIAKKPWQKLRKNILMFIQIIVVALVAFALSEPYIKGGKEASHYIIVMDTSASMSATDVSPTRFEYSKKEIEKIIDNASPDTYFTVVSAGKYPHTVIEHSQGKDNAKRVVSDVKQSLESVDMKATLEIIKTVKSNHDGNVYVFTDTGFDSGDLEDIQIVSVKNSDDNAGITLLSENNGNVLVKVKNYGDETVKRNVTLYNGNDIIDVLETDIEGKSNADLYFDIDSSNISNLKAVLSPEDNFKYDDEYYYTINKNTSKKALLFSDDNIFIEKVLSVIPGIEIYKGEKDFINNAEGYSLYIYDGVLPENMPKDGHVMVFSPPKENNILNVLGETELSENVTEVSCDITKNIQNMNAAILKAKNIEVPSWGQVFLKSGDTPVAFYGDNKGQKTVVFSFDVRNTDIPLKMEFPIIMYNCINYFFPERNTDILNIFTGDDVNINLLPDTKEAYILKPSGDKVNIAPPFPADIFTSTDEKGIYTLCENNSSGIAEESVFAVNTVRDFDNIAEYENNGEETDVKKVSSTDKSLGGILIIIVLLALIVEWWVNCHES